MEGSKIGICIDGGTRSLLHVSWPGRVPIGRDDVSILSAADFLPTLLAGAAALKTAVPVGKMPPARGGSRSEARSRLPRVREGRPAEAPGQRQCCPELLDRRRLPARARLVAVLARRRAAAVLLMTTTILSKFI